MNAILGQGSFGTVYLTKETDDYGGRLRAVKVIDAAQWGKKGASKKQILAEVKNWVKLADSPQQLLHFHAILLGRYVARKTADK